MKSSIYTQQNKHVAYIFHALSEKESNWKELAPCKHKDWNLLRLLCPMSLHNSYDEQELPGNAYFWHLHYIICIKI